MKRSARLLLSAFMALSLGLTALHADTITLKSGEKVEGKITAETDADVTVQVKISAAITDERTISKSEIDKIDKITEDTEAYNTIKNFKTNDDHSYPLDSYDQMLTSLGAFIQQYPLSTHLADVKQQQAALIDEQARVQKGGLKFNGQWLTPDEAAKQKYEIEASQLFQLIKGNAAEGNYGGALNAYDLMSRSYNGARVYPDTVDYIKSLVPNLLREAQGRLNGLIAEQKKFMADVQFRQEPQKTQFITAARNEQEGYKASLRSATGTWKPYISRSNDSLQAYIQQLPGLMSQLGSIQTANLHQAQDLLMDAKSSLDMNDLPGAQKAITQADKLWPANHELKDIKAAYQKASAAADAKRKAAAKPSTTPKPAMIAAATPDPVKATPETPFFLSIKGALLILGIVVVIAVAIAILGKVRKNQDDQEA
ncbi:MAG: hypothetical protein QM796_17895 [Chthoniobacteraceae bacterium]